MLHALKRVAQLTYLVVVLDTRQRCREVSLGHFVGRLGQLLQRAGGALDDDASHDAGDQQGDGYEYQQDGADGHAQTVDDEAGDGQGYRPVGALDGLIEHVGIETLEIEILEVGGLAPLVMVSTTVAGRHAASYMVVDGVGCCLGALEVIAIDDEGRVGMGNVRSVAVDDKVIRQEAPLAVVVQAFFITLIKGFMVAVIVAMRVAADVNVEFVTVIPLPLDALSTEPS